MKNTTTPLVFAAAAAVAALTFTSCGSMDPEYKAWKEKQKAAADNPYGAPAAGANPYGVPQTAGEAGTYTPAADGAAPYQPLPGVTGGDATTPDIPAAPAVGGGSHTVVSGDSLWGLARKYNTTIEAIQAANGLTDTTIRTGQTLTIPAQ
ncbi:hypothetical protein NT6N_10170 [Oceaniferula spumae]|uniref:LysM domain-containing protein n=1 Tax=Oceaniferula spumae TaxID=2979115 RepID=A0AAT9FJ71_9BACT